LSLALVSVTAAGALTDNARRVPQPSRSPCPRRNTC